MSSEAPARLVQLIHPQEGRRVAIVDGPNLRLLATFRSAYSFAKTAVEMGWKLRDLLSTDLSGITIDYDAAYRLETPWQFLASFDQSDEPARCLVSSAGSGPDGWCYLGLGATLKGHGEPILLPTGHLPPRPLGDIAAVYVIGSDGAPWRVGATPALSFSEAAFPTRSNVLGPELILDPALPSLEGAVAIYRENNRVWEECLSSRGAPLLYALASLEPGHFRYADHHRPGDAHIHLIGAGVLGPRQNAAYQIGDVCEVQWEGLGKPLRSSLMEGGASASPTAASAL